MSKLRRITPCCGRSAKKNNKIGVSRDDTLPVESEGPEGTSSDDIHGPADEPSDPQRLDSQSDVTEEPSSAGSTKTRKRFPRPKMKTMIKGPTTVASKLGALPSLGPLSSMLPDIEPPERCSNCVIL